MTIKVKLTPSITSTRTVNLTLGDIGCTQDEWNEMSEQQQSEAIYDAVNGFDDLYWAIENFETTE